MKERPILFTGEMVRAILEGRKTQTRRVIQPEPVTVDRGLPWRYVPGSRADVHLQVEPIPCRYGGSGDRLWVKEAWLGDRLSESDPPVLHYRADDTVVTRSFPKWKSSMFMPRWASRITLEIVSVRVERLQSITEDDAEREGILDSARTGYAATFQYEELWESINGKKHPWDSNPWVFVIEFRRVNV